MLDVYEAPCDEKWPLVYFDGSPMPLTGEVRVTTTYKKIDFAQAMKHIVGRYAGADVIRVVLDNRNTHKIIYTLPRKAGYALSAKPALHC